MYHDREDPFQLTNRVADPRAAEKQAELRAALDRWLTRTGDRFETAQAIADRYFPNHRNGVAPYHSSPAVQAAMKDPSLRRFARSREVGSA
jgi:hypothetical protein